jgi:hypothetical protein
MTCGRIVLASLLLTAVASASASGASVSRIGKPSWRLSGKRSSSANIVGSELYSRSIATTTATTSSSNHFNIGSSLCGRRRGVSADRRSTRTSDENCYYDPAAEECLLFLKDEEDHRANSNNDDDIRTTQPCRSIGNTLARGALLRIASDMSVSCRCPVALSAGEAWRASFFYSHFVFFFARVCSGTITGRNSSRKHQNTR